ncbi:hypothetical protein Tco_1021375 [Tanacetum coccineum]
MEILLESTSNSSVVGSYALSWKPCQGDSSKLNLPGHRWLPEGGLLEGGLPEGGLPHGGLPRGGLPRGGLPRGGLPCGGLPRGGLPGGGLPKQVAI